MLWGNITTISDVLDLTALASRVMDRHELRRLLIDARTLPSHLPADACQAAKQWLGEGSCQQLAWVVPQIVDAGTVELAVTQINMSSLSSALPLRAFGVIIDAHRWLDAKPGERRLSSTMSSVRPPGSGAPGERTTTPPRGQPAEPRERPVTGRISRQSDDPDAAGRISRPTERPPASGSSSRWPAVTLPAEGTKGRPRR